MSTPLDRLRDRLSDPPDEERKRIADELRKRIEDAKKGRNERPPYSIDPATGRLRAPSRPKDGVTEAFNPMPFPMRAAIRARFRVLGEQRERTYEVQNEAEALTRLAMDEPGAYEITLERTEIPVAP